MPSTTRATSEAILYQSETQPRGLPCPLLPHCALTPDLLTMHNSPESLHGLGNSISTLWPQ